MRGLAIGRLDLTSVRTAVRLLTGGLALALAASFAAGFVLFRLGGEHRLWQGEFSDVPGRRRASTCCGTTRTATPGGPCSPGRRTAPPLRHASHARRSRGAARRAAAVEPVRQCEAAVRALAAAGSMPLTFYCVHVLFLATGLLSGDPVARYVVMATAALLFAAGWRRAWGQGPLEAVISKAAKRARQAVAIRTEETS
ncbi:hypothetical protein NKH77_01870 [Streptomyces sp. M19]